MKTLEVRFTADNGKVWTDWIPEADVAQVKAEARTHNLSVRVLGEVSWQRQLAAMETQEI